MRVELLGESGWPWAMRGLALNKNQPVSNMDKVADKLAPMEGGHNKFLESIQIWVEIKAPRYFWQEFDTYRVGVTKQSQSTIHTGTKRKYLPTDFTEHVRGSSIDALNVLVQLYNETEDKEEKQFYFESLKSNMPEGLLQTRVVNMNYKTLRNIYRQRKNHKLREWHIFLDKLFDSLTFPEYLE